MMMMRNTLVSYTFALATESLIIGVLTMHPLEFYENVSMLHPTIEFVEQFGQRLLVMRARQSWRISTRHKVRNDMALARAWIEIRVGCHL